MAFWRMRGFAKGHISKKLLLQINVPFYKITPTISEKMFFRVSDIYETAIYRDWDILTLRGWGMVLKAAESILWMINVIEV